MDEQAILRVISNEFNTHWETGGVPESRALNFKRRDFFTIMEQLENEKITSVIGPRRVGKTTIMFQMVEHLVKEGKIDKKRVIYASMDNAYLQNASDEVIRDVLAVYSRHILKEELSSLKDRIYVFLDEIQYVDDWQKKLKSWFDYKYKIKFIVSGSSSVMIQKGAAHLIGRIHERIIFPLKFSDALDYGKGKREYSNIGKQLRESFRNSAIKKDGSYFWKEISSLSYELTKRMTEMEHVLAEFLIKGGYPELLGKKNYAECALELKDTILSKSILDIVERHKIRNVGLLRYLIALIASKSGSRLTHLGISQDLGIERPTVVSHMEYLENAFLISKSGFYSKKLPVAERKEKKYYINDIGMRNSMVGMMSETLLKSPEAGIAAETAAFDHTKRLKFFLSRHQNTDVSYWHSDAGEVDMVLDTGPIPIEVKYQARISESDTTAMSYFIRKHKSPFGIVVTRNELRQSDKIFFLPLSIYLLMC
ncbi:MAG: ATP-binding protein [Candidatus Aenigmarchaeota archaeon]|nr:ATP-binding protein [Candidatus Aenigmarchaeota archaeon]MDI6722593.1 ATP-binding protein [Candidatus Aenigmarchaeota archaeon]